MILQKITKTLTHTKMRGMATGNGIVLEGQRTVSEYNMHTPADAVYVPLTHKSKHEMVKQEIRVYDTLSVCH